MNGISVHRLISAEAWIAFSAKIDRKTPDAMQVTLLVEKECEVSTRVRPVNRGFNSVIEATVHATRYVDSLDQDLKHLIDHHAVIIRKCGGAREREALELLDRFMRRQTKTLDTTPESE